jgi:Tfp pilus assembly protein FimT
MALLAIIAVVAVPFVVFWWAGRGLRANQIRTPENPDAWAAGSDHPTDHHGSH